MTVDPAWEAAHAARAWGRYPHPGLVEFIGRHYGILETGVRAQTAIDLGCGAGASALFLAREGFEVTAIDGSASALDRLARRMDKEPIWMAQRVRLCHADVSTFDWRGGGDVVTDICCLSCLSLHDAERVICRVSDWLKRGGRFISVMAADDCEPSIHGEFAVRQSSIDDIKFLFGGMGFSNQFVGKHTRMTRRGFISEWVVEAQK